MTGAVLLMVTVLEAIAAESALPSFAVAWQYTVLPLLKYVPVSVLVVWAIRAPLTYQA